MNYYLILLLSKFLGHEVIIEYFRKRGITIGENTHVFSRIVTSEPYLITIGNGCTISTNVSLLTHDASIGAILGRNQQSDLCGKITIGDHSFIGSGAIILPGVYIPNKCIVAAGAVVVKSVIEEGVILGGNPAKIIGHVDKFIIKNNDKFMSIHGISLSERKKYILSHDNQLLAK